MNHNGKTTSCSDGTSSAGRPGCLARGSRFRAVFVVVLMLVSLTVADFASAADRIRMRDLRTIPDRSVVRFDVDGIVLDDGTELGWDFVEAVTLADGEKQAEFDRLLRELGTPLFLIRQRLRVEDYEGALPHAESVSSRYVGRDSSTAYLVFQALMWARLAAGRREAAVEPYLRCLEILRGRRQMPALPGPRRLRYDAGTALSAELMPVWFDRQGAAAAMPGVFAAISAMRQPRPQGAYIYYATLALAAGDLATAERVLNVIQEAGPVGELKEIALAQRELVAGQAAVAAEQLQARLPSFSDATRPLALYWTGMAKLALDERRESGMLDLLRIAAHYGREQPELAAAALFHTSRALEEAGQAAGSVAVRNELLIQYSQTQFAARIRRGAEADSR